MSWMDRPLCADCAHEDGEHIRYKVADADHYKPGADPNGGYCHACWFNGDIRDEEAMRRAEHLFKPKSADRTSGSL